MASSFSRKSVRAGLAVAVAVLVLLATEGAVRLLGIAPQLQLQYPRMVPDPYLPFRPPANATYVTREPSGDFEHRVRTNSAGFRDTEHAIPKPPGVFRIVALGDSFTFGTGARFEETYLARLERLLNRRQGRHPTVEIVKAGVPRFYTEPERLLLEHYGLAYEPDLVLVGFTPNDVSDTAWGLDAVTTDPSGFLKTQEAKQLGAVGHWLFLHSHAARIILAEHVRRRTAANHPVRWEEIYRADGFHEKDWRAIEAELTRMRELAHDAGCASFVVLCIPHRGPWGEEALYPARRLRRWAAANHALVVDVLPAFRAAGQRKQLFHQNDPHCTPDGYAVIARTLFQRLQAAEVIP